MKRTRRCLVGTIVTAGVFLATAVASMAETYTLTLKRRETGSAASGPASFVFWSVQPQYFYVQMVADENGRWRPAGPDSQADAFKRIVKKEPKYQSENPFRGVVKLGSQEYAFALDVVAPKAAPKAKKADAKKAAATTCANGGDVVVSLVATSDASEAAPAAKPGSSSTAEKPRPKPAPARDFSYNRLYFDFNRNGDLTDDKVIEVPADSKQSVAIASPSMSYVRFEFPRVDLTIDVEGTKVDYAFHLDGYSYSSAKSGNVMVSVSSAICREGDITVEGKRHHVVLLDNNSNGRFDDLSKISSNIHMASGQLYAEPGDTLLIDPKTSPGTFDSPYDSNSSDYRYPLAEIALIDGKWYDLKVSPAGDKLTLNPSTAAVGSVSNRNDFRGLIYSDGKGFLKIHGTKGAPIPVPEGQWKLFSYTITQVNRPPEPAKPSAKAGAEKGPADTKSADGKSADKTAKAKQGSLFSALGQMITGGSRQSEGPSFASATATDKYKAVTVRKGATVELPFGPPYKPTVTAMSYYAVPQAGPGGKAEQLSLEMGLVGVGGEQCTNLMVKGSRPGKPEFTITDPGGKVVQQGNFEYG